MRGKNFLARVLLATTVVGSMSLSIGSASAVMSRNCLDGTKVVDPKQCQIVEAQESSPALAR
jgi:hypothetical protein